MRQGRFLTSAMGVALVLLGPSSRVIQEDQPPKPPTVGQRAIPFSLEDLNGTRVNLSDFLGKNQAVILTFWATWCSPCVAELADIQRFYEDRRKHDTLLLTIDFGEEPQTVRNLVQKKRYTFPVLLDYDGKVTRQYGAMSAGVPLTVVIGPDGRVVRSDSEYWRPIAKPPEGVVKATSDGLVFVREGRVGPEWLLSRGIWTNNADGLYVDAEGSRVYVLASSKGSERDALLAADAAAEKTHRWMGDRVCPDEAKVTPQRLKTIPAYLQFMQITARRSGLSLEERISQVPSCETDLFLREFVRWVFVDKKGARTWVLWQLPPETRIESLLEVWRTRSSGTDEPHPMVNDYMPILKEQLKSEGRVISTPPARLSPK